MALDPVSAGIGGVEAAAGIAQMAYGYYNQKKNKRPDYQIPEEIKQNLNQAQQQALQGLPEEQKQQYLSNLQRGSAQALASAGTRKGGLQGIAGLADAQNQGYANLLGMDSAARQANQQNLYAQKQNMADYKDKAWGINKENPYYEKTAQNQALQGAGMQNAFGGLQMIAGSSTGGKSKTPFTTGATGQGQEGMNYQGQQYPTNIG